MMLFIYLSRSIFRILLVRSIFKSDWECIRVNFAIMNSYSKTGKILLFVFNERTIFFCVKHFLPIISEDEDGVREKMIVPYLVNLSIIRSPLSWHFEFMDAFRIDVIGFTIVLRKQTLCATFQQSVERLLQNIPLGPYDVSYYTLFHILLNILLRTKRLITWSSDGSSKIFIRRCWGSSQAHWTNTGQQRTVMKVYLVVSCLQFTDTLNKYNYIKYITIYRYTE
jgi:hypothetical protein